MAHQRLKGATHAVFDGRMMMKQIACVARHPSVERCKKLRGLPGTLTTSSWLANARRFLGDEGVDGFAEFAGGRGKGKGDGGGAAEARAEEEEEEEEEEAPDADADANVYDDDANAVRAQLASFTSLAASLLPGWPAHALAYLERALVARGGAKALSIRRVLYTGSHTTGSAWWTPILKDFARRLSPPRVPRFQSPASAPFNSI